MIAFDIFFPPERYIFEIEKFNRKTICFALLQTFFWKWNEISHHQICINNKKTLPKYIREINKYFHNSLRCRWIVISKKNIRKKEVYWVHLCKDSTVRRFQDGSVSISQRWWRYLAHKILFLHFGEEMLFFREWK